MKTGRADLLISIAIVALVAVVFGRTVTFDFVNYDDPIYVYQTPAITAGLWWNSVPWAFTHLHGQNWHPLTTLSHMLDCQLYGIAPAGHHLSNLLLHAAAAAFLFLTLRRMTAAMWRSAFVAAVFAIHPLRVESVAWIAERKDVLSGLFFVVTLAAYTRYVRTPTLVRYLATLLSFAAGLLSKPMLVTTPFVLLLLDYWPFQRIRSGSVVRIGLEKMPMLVLSALSCGATLVAQRRYIGIGEELPFNARVTNAIVSYLTYVGQMLWPVNLAPFYPHRESNVPAGEIVAAVVFLVALTTVAIVLRRRRPYLLVGWFWYIGMLVPVIGVVQVGWQSHADRYTYLPQIGFSIAAVWLLADVAAKLRIARLVLAGAASCVLLVFGAAAFAQAGYWRNSETLWTHTLAVSPRNDVAENNLGILLAEGGRYDEAIAHYEAALRVRPLNAVAHLNLGNAMILSGNLPGALAELHRALEIDPANVDVHNALGVMRLQRGDIHGAIDEWNQTLAVDQENGNAANNLAWVYATSSDATFRDGNRAVALATKATDVSAGRNAVVLRTLAAAYAEDGRFDDAILTAERARKIAETQKNSGLVAELDAIIALYRIHKPLRDPSIRGRQK
ncbi:MAG: tetratricopeptide repeat protein [Chthoniobacterales bacterium]